MILPAAENKKKSAFQTMVSVLDVRQQFGGVVCAAGGRVVGWGEEGDGGERNVIQDLWRERGRVRAHAFDTTTSAGRYFEHPSILFVAIGC